MSNTDSTKKPGCALVLAKGKQFLPLIDTRHATQIVRTCWTTPRFFGGVRVAHLSSFLCCDFSFVSLCSVLYLPNVACVSRLFIIAFPFGFAKGKQFLPLIDTRHATQIVRTCWTQQYKSASTNNINKTWHFLQTTRGQECLANCKTISSSS
jgi:hypothetical protein